MNQKCNHGGDYLSIQIVFKRVLRVPDPGGGKGEWGFELSSSFSLTEGSTTSSGS